MHLAKWEWKKIMRDWKTRLLLLGFFLFFSSFSLLYKQQTLTFPEAEMNEQYQTIHQLFNSIPESVFTGEDGKDVYDTMAKQQMLYGMQLYILSKRDGNEIKGLEHVFDSYLENGVNIARNNAYLLELDQFEYYAYLISYLPDETDIYRDLAFFNYMDEKGIDIEWNAFSASTILVEEVNMMIGLVLFLFVALLACDSFSRDQLKNWSITHGLPVHWKKQWRLRSLQLWLLMWAASLLGLATSYIISLIVESSGSLIYPIMINWQGGYLPIPVWQYVCLALAFAMMVSFVLMLLATGLSWIFRTIYLTIVTIVALFFLPSLWTVIQPLSSWQPSLYFHIEDVFTSDTFAQLGVNIWKGPIVMIGLVVIIELIFHVVFDHIQTQTLGLKRRTSQ